MKQILILTFTILIALVAIYAAATYKPAYVLDNEYFVELCSREADSSVCD